MRTLTLVFLALLLMGCGSEDEPYLAAGPPIDPSCRDAGRAGARMFRACYKPLLTGQPQPVAKERHGKLQVSESNGP